MRLAWFTPWPPQSSGIAGRSAALVPALAHRGHAIDVFVDERVVPTAGRADDLPPTPGDIRVQSAHDFVWRALRGQYELVVYQLGNSRQHAFTWPYLFRWPGLAVLHDVRLHHARGYALLSRGLVDQYRAEFRMNHPDVPPDAAELAVAGFGGAYYYLWPMTRAVVQASRLTAVHSRGGAAALQADFPERPIDYAALSSGRADLPSDAERERARDRLGFAAGDVVFGLFGGLTEEKRVAQVLRAFRWTRARVPAARLLLAGAAAPELDLDTLVLTLGLADVVRRHEGLDDDAFEAAIGAVDISLNLRWPTAVETSGPWLQALAAARATIVTELEHQAHVPALDPRSWQPWMGDRRQEPVAVAIDLLDEDHSLRLAMGRLATDSALRRQLGQAGRRYWEQAHSMTHMVDDYERVLARAAACPLPPGPSIPGYDPVAPMRALLASVGNVSCELF